MAGPMRDTFRDVARVLANVSGDVARGSSAPAPAKAPTPSEIDSVIRAFVAALPRSFAIEVPGQHTGGISYNALLMVLAGQGRDFLATTVQLVQTVRNALRREFVRAPKLPSTQALRDVAGPAILEHVELRLSRRGNYDISAQPLTAEYAKRKRAAGRGGQPIGVATGELRAAFSRKARILWRAA